MEETCVQQGNMIARNIYLQKSIQKQLKHGLNRSRYYFFTVVMYRLQSEYNSNSKSRMGRFINQYKIYYERLR